MEQRIEILERRIQDLESMHIIDPYLALEVQQESYKVWGYNAGERVRSWARVHQENWEREP